MNESTRFLPDGLYEAVITEGLERALEAMEIDSSDTRQERRSISSDEVDTVLSRHLAPLIRHAIASSPETARVANATDLANEIIQVLHNRAPKAFDSIDQVSAAKELLLAVSRTGSQPGAPQLPRRPSAPLSESALLTNARGEPAIGHELAAELESAGGVDLICAFIKWTGVRRLLDVIRKRCAAGARVRVITTTYLGSTDRRAVDELASAGAEVKVSYDTDSTRLHAKAWLFERSSGFSTAFVGSSNLSNTALHDGLEWNVRVSQIGNPELLDKFRASFETYWADPAFESYDPARDAKKFDQAIGQERGSEDRPDDIVLVDIYPKPFQQRFLDQLEIERTVHGQWRNLVVSATGTGKTVVAALDYRRLLEDIPDASLLFVAHRQEILTQSRKMFRTVLADGSFGELYVDGHQPNEWHHVFASVQSLGHAKLERVPSTHFDVVIVDEFHHAAAPTYQRLLDHLEPRVLLGLTATPERADGKSITHWFDDHIAAELRLWEAVDEGLLAPFQYFGIHDDVDVSGLSWQRGGYQTSELSNLYTGNDARVAKILRAVREKVLDPLSMRALGFCVSVDHARYMEQKFNAAGIPALSVAADTPTDDRKRAITRLGSGDINIIFAVDLFNEGLDVPHVDTVLFLRPTESATVFIQQLGRGLRQAPGKTGLTALDFVGHQHSRFRFDLRLRALTHSSRREVREQVEQDFPFLPAGCNIDLDRDVKDLVLQNLKQSLTTTWRQRVRALNEIGPVDLRAFLAETELELADLYRGSKPGWWRLRAEAGVGPSHDESDETGKSLTRGIGRILHVDDPERLLFYGKVLDEPAPPVATDFDERERRMLTMLHFGLWGVSKPTESMEWAFRQLWDRPVIRDELSEVIDILRTRAVLTEPLGVPGPIPVALHGRYSRDEILGAFGLGTVENPPTSREGVKWDEDSACDLFFVTLNKSEQDYSPTTLYRDYAISPELFHWESQSTTSEASPTGQRYINHQERGSHVLLFAREDKRTVAGRTVPYLALGPCSYMSHTGERPMAMTWRLRNRIPAEFFEEARVAAG